VPEAGSYTLSFTPTATGSLVVCGLNKAEAQASADSTATVVNP
jgi:hypothetical protein